MGRVVFAAILSAEGRVPPEAIFREKIEAAQYRMYCEAGLDQAGS